MPSPAIETKKSPDEPKGDGADKTPLEKTDQQLEVAVSALEQARQKGKLPSLSDFDVELGDTTKRTSRPQVARMYSEVYSFIKDQLQEAERFGKIPKVIVGEQHTTDIDGQLVVLAALDASKRLGIDEFKLELDKEGISTVIDPENYKPGLLRAGYYTYAYHVGEKNGAFKSSKTNFKPGDPKNERTPKTNKLVEEYDAARDSGDYKTMLIKGQQAQDSATDERREKPMLWTILGGKPSFHVHGAAHLLYFYKAFNSRGFRDEYHPIYVIAANTKNSVFQYQRDKELSKILATNPPNMKNIVLQGDYQRKFRVNNFIMLTEITNNFEEKPTGPPAKSP